jgi:hypothetical protein
MITEYAQLLSSAVQLFPNKKHGIGCAYKLAHKNHPSTIWTRTSLSNWRWLKQLAKHLADEYTFRYGKIHKAWLVISKLPEPSIPDMGLTKLACAMPKHLIVDCPIQSYRSYYARDKSHLFDYKNREVPKWLHFYFGTKKFEK